MLKLAFRNLFRHGVRTLLTLVAIVFGVVGLVLSGGFVEDVFIQLRESTIHSQLGHVQVLRRGYTELGRREPYAYLISDPGPIAELAATQAGVIETLTRLSFSALANNGKADLPILAEGVQADRETRLGSFISYIEGRPLADSDLHGVAIGKGVAKALKLAPGATVTVLATTPDGAMNSLEFTVVGVFQSFSRDYDERAVRVNLSDAQDLLTTAGAHAVVLSLQSTDLTDTVADALRKQFGAANIEVKTWYELADFYQKTVALYRQQFGVLQLIVLVMVLLSVANSVNMAIFERTGEFGTLMALGNRRSLVFRLIMLEYSILGLAGGILGIAAGVGLAYAIAEVGIPMPPPPGSDVGYTAHVRLVPWVLIPAFVVGCIASVVAAILPARRAAGLDVVEALRANI